MTLVWSGTPTVNLEQTATLTFRDNDVRALYVDWDDGVSNKKTDANYQWVELTEPQLSVEVKHTYNKQGTFNPVVQTVNSRGYVSRYYSTDSSTPGVVPWSRDTGIAPITIADAAPTAIMRIENTLVNPGIDNTIFDVEGIKDVYFAVAPTLTQAELQTIKQVKIQVEGIIELPKYNITQGGGSYSELGSNRQQKKLDLTVDIDTAGTQKNLYNILSGAAAPFVGGATTHGGWSKILKFSYMSPKAYLSGSNQTNAGSDYTRNELYNRLKLFLVVKANNGDYYPISYVTAGMPIKSVEDKNRYSTLEFGQSRAAASNISLSNYRYDNAKMWSSYWPVNNWSLSSNILSTPLQSGTTYPAYFNYLTPNAGINTTGSIVGAKLFEEDATSLWYTDGGSIRNDLIIYDDFGRIYDQYYNARLSVLASSTSGSNINTNQPDVIFCKPTADFTSPRTPQVTIGVDYTTAMKNNTSGSSFIVSGVNALADGGNDMFTTPMGAETEQDYILLGFDSTTNKVFLNTANYGQGLMTDDASSQGLTIAGVEYLAIEDSGTKAQNAYWKPVKFEDTTRIHREYKSDGDEKYYNYYTSLSKSGYITFDMPLDWTSTSLKNLCGGVYNTASGTLADCIADAGKEPDGTTDRDVILTGTFADVASGSSYGLSSTLTAAGTHVYDEMSKIGTADEVGSHRYIGIIKSGSVTTSDSCSGAAYWVTTGLTGNGWNGATDSSSSVTFQWGVTGGTDVAQDWKKPTGSCEVIIRRVNVYDVVKGASKIIQDDTTNTTVADANIMPVESDLYNNTASYFQNRYNCSGAWFTGTDWSGSAKYLLKVTLSGQTGTPTGDPSAIAVPQIENIFDATQGDSAIIKQVDDSAYNLNSLAITSNVRVSRGGVYYKAITRKGKVILIKTGINLSNIGFSSVALGDENSSTAFADQGSSTLYGHLHNLRRIQAEDVPVYWDEPQKDGTFIRIWGVVTDINESFGTSGPRRIVNYTFNMPVKQIALLSNNGDLMTDIYPLGGVPNERDYS